MRKHRLFIFQGGAEIQADKNLTQTSLTKSHRENNPEGLGTIQLVPRSIGGVICIFGLQTERSFIYQSFGKCLFAKTSSKKK